MSKLRLWRLGSLEHKIIPTYATIRKLAEHLDGWKANETLDLIWGPDIQYQEIDIELDGQQKVINVIIPDASEDIVAKVTEGVKKALNESPS